MTSEPTTTYGDVDPENDPILNDTADDFTILQGLQATLAKKAELKPITIPVKVHTGVSVRYSVAVESDLLTRWRRRWMNKKGTELDLLRFSRTVIANQAEQIIFKGQEPNDAQGNPLSFKSRDLWNMVGAHDAGEAVQNFFQVDPHIIATCNVILEEAGYLMDDDSMLDPTSDD